MWAILPVVFLLSTAAAMAASVSEDSAYLDYNNIGCFADKGARAIPHMTTFLITSNAVQDCANLAKKNGYNVFAVQFGNQCYSGPEAGKTFDKYGESKACKNGVGGDWANDVYRFEAKHRIGCFKDVGSNRAFPQHLKTFPANVAVAKCEAIARAKGLTIFAVQNGGECWSGPASEQHYAEHGVASNCANGVGGSWANDVYALRDYHSVGCFGDNIFWRAIWNFPPYQIYPTNTAVANCAYHAKHHGYEGFAVQYDLLGRQCYIIQRKNDKSYAKNGPSKECRGGVGAFSANDVYFFY